MSQFISKREEEEADALNEIELICSRLPRLCFEGKESAEVGMLLEAIASLTAARAVPHVYTCTHCSEEFEPSAKEHLVIFNNHVHTSWDAGEQFKPMVDRRLVYCRDCAEKTGLGAAMDLC